MCLRWRDSQPSAQQAGPHPGRHAQGSDERRLGKVPMWHCLAQSSCRFGVPAIAATVADGLTAGRMRSGPQTRVVSVKPALGLVGPSAVHRRQQGNSVGCGDQLNSRR
jgi:hypothetical protein